MGLVLLHLFCTGDGFPDPTPPPPLRRTKEMMYREISTEVQCGVTGRDLSIVSIPTEVLLRFIVDLPIDVDAVAYARRGVQGHSKVISDASIPSDKRR